MSYSVELSKLAAKGTTLFDTSFGLSFTGDAKMHRKIAPRQQGSFPRLVGEERERVIRLLSPCCLSSYREEKDSYLCRICSKPSPWPIELLNFEMSRDEGMAASTWEEILRYYFKDTFEAMLVATGIVNIIEEVFRAIEGGARTRTVVLTANGAEI